MYITYAAYVCKTLRIWNGCPPARKMRRSTVIRCWRYSCCRRYGFGFVSVVFVTVVRFQIYEDSVISNQTLICNKCCDSVEEMHVFRERCIKNINLFKTYVRQLRTYSKINGTINIQLTRCDQPAWSPSHARKQKEESMRNDKQKYFNRCTMRLYGTPKFGTRIL